MMVVLVDYDAAGNDFDRYLRESQELEEFVLETAEVGADLWALKSRWRTGFNATHVRAFTHRGPGGQIEGVIDAWGHYARYREHGTRYNAAEGILDSYKDVVEGL